MAPLPEAVSPRSGPEGRAWPRPLRMVRHHVRLFGAAAVGVTTYLALAGTAHTTTRVLLGWDVGVAVYLILALGMVMAFDPDVARERAAIQDEGGPWLLILTVAAAVASLGAVIAELGSIHGKEDPREGLYFGLAVGTVVLSWTFIHVIFALHYAHEYYGEPEGAGGLKFPDDDHPDYWDFVYFSFVIGMTFQVSDVEVTSKLLRRLVVAHGFVSFTYNVAILSLVVNLGASIV